ncbi:MAG: NAD(P)H-binding protein [Bifidobacteriaceae bacterium]|jgi:putative NADH-flavin reductase|nr:NAD(P)H-binding protein [Bifidobacteriaceae bacterium]
MSHIVVLGGTGYAGSAIAKEAVARGHRVTVVARHGPSAPTEGATYIEGSATDDDVVNGAIGDSDILVVALAPRGALAGKLRPLARHIAELARTAGIRLGVVGGAGSLLSAPGGPRILQTRGFPAAVKPEAAEMAGVLDDLRASPQDLDWFMLSPAIEFGAHAPGEALGAYREGGDFPVTDDDGRSEISGPDFALAFVDEIERPAHSRQRFTVAH